VVWGGRSDRRGGLTCGLRTTRSTTRWHSRSSA
jgi:hypothetical protein